MTKSEKETVLSLRQQQYSFSAIAQATGLPIGTIKSFLSRLRGKEESSVTAPCITAEHSHCRECGAPLKQVEHRKVRSFCNDQCRVAYWNKHRDLSQRASAHQQTCEICGRVFYTYHGQYCSRACSGAARSRKAGVYRE